MKKAEMINNILWVWLNNEIYDRAWKKDYGSTSPAIEQRRIAFDQVIDVTDLYRERTNLWFVLKKLERKGYIWVRNLNTDMTYDRLLYLDKAFTDNGKDKFICSDEEFLNRIPELVKIETSNDLDKFLKKLSPKR